jgi:hypothetical protein
LGHSRASANPIKSLHATGPRSKSPNQLGYDATEFYNPANGKFVVSTTPQNRSSKDPDQAIIQTSSTNHMSDNLEALRPVLHLAQRSTVKSRKTLISLCLVVVILVLGAFALRYRQYAHAAAWHCLHPATIKFGAHEIEIPRLWWAGKTDNAGRISILRACKSSVLIDPEIEVAPVSPGEVAENDSEQSRLVQAVVSDRNRNAQAGWAYSSMNLKTKSFVWYCTKDQQTILGHNFSTTLKCNAPRIPYSLHYQGPPEQESEAELIFASFQ